MLKNPDLCTVRNRVYFRPRRCSYRWYAYGLLSAILSRVVMHGFVWVRRSKKSV